MKVSLQIDAKGDIVGLEIVFDVVSFGLVRLALYSPVWARPTVTLLCIVFKLMLACILG